MRLQSSVRTLVLVVAVAGVSAAGMQAWWVSRIVYLVERHSALVDSGRLDDAEANARRTLWLYPNSPVAEFMHHQCEVMRKLQRGEMYFGGFSCQ
jgi:hypothetical protein